MAILSNKLQAIFFDFDGVLVDSVEVKTKAFAYLFEPFGKEVVAKVIEHHRLNGGMSRFEKFRYYYKEFLGKRLSDIELNVYCQRFADLVVEEVVKAPEIPGAEAFLHICKGSLPCFVVSAAPEGEIREIVKRRGWEEYFKEVCGAPSTKKGILEMLLKRYQYNSSYCLYFGDAESDYKAAKSCNLYFIGIAKDLDSPLLKSQLKVEWIRDFSISQLESVKLI